MDSHSISYQVKKAIRKIDPDAQVYLFGSKARGDDHASSDWDFLILTSASLTELKKRQIRASLIDTELETEQVISTIIYSKSTWKNYRNTPLYRNIKNDGIEI